jgi:hypothetical protein
MKTLSYLSAILFILFLFPNKISAQGLLKENRIWSEYTHGSMGNSYSTLHYKVEGDTLILGKTYKKTWICGEEPPVNWQYSRATRDNDSGQIFANNSGVETLLYDFNLTQGDSTNVLWAGQPNAYAIIVDSININGEYKKRIFIGNSPQSSTYFCDIWIKDIGSYFSGIGTTVSHCMLGSWDTLLCVNDNGVPVYQNPAYTGCYFTNVGIGEISDKVDVSLTPNPVSDLAVFSSTNTNLGQCNIEIISQMGITVKSITVDDLNQFVLSKSDYAPGLYFYRLSFKTKTICGKLIVQ